MYKTVQDIITPHEGELMYSKKHKKYALVSKDGELIRDGYDALFLASLKKDFYPNCRFIVLEVSESEIEELSYEKVGEILDTDSWCGRMYLQS